MKIIASALKLTAEHASHQEDTATSSFTFRQDAHHQNADPAASSTTADLITLSNEAKERASLPAPSPQSVTDPSSADADLVEDPHLRVMRLTLELLTGRKIPVTGFQSTASEASSTAHLAAVNGEPPAPDGGAAGHRQGWGMVYDYWQTHAEQESTSFSANGLVVTADGRQIALAFDLLMQQQSSTQSHLHLQAGDAPLVDPLVINFSGQGTRMSDVHINFDLDVDGTPDELTFVSPDSGYLALDRNNDGKINDGAELFGPVRGQGFVELAAYDADANGWLDENDPIFDKLKVWMADQAGNQRLASLSDMRIGALLLTPLDTEFRLTDANQSLLGRIRQTSLALLADGAPTSVQEVDLVA